MSEIWNGFVQALEEILRFLFEYTHSAGLAIIVFTVAVKLLLLPITIRQLRSSREMQKLQPKLRSLQKKYANDREKLNEEMMKLYREHGVNPMAGCLPSLLQIPIFFGVYYAVLNLSRVPSLGAWVGHWVGWFFAQGNAPALDALRASLGRGILANESFLWMQSMGQPDPWHLLPILAGVFQLIQQRMMTQKSSDPQQSAMSNAMMFMPLMIVFIGWNFPAGPVLYWVTQSLFSVVQQYFISGWGALRDWLPFLPERKPRQEAAVSNQASAPAESSERMGLFGGLFGRAEDEEEDQRERESAPQDSGATIEERRGTLPPPPEKRRSRR